jgi:interferon-induced transmembrane protein/zinc ribbon protein
MFCRKCGTENLENNYQCTQCGEILHAPPAPQVVVTSDETLGGMVPMKNGGAPTPAAPAAKPAVIPNYLVPAIICSVLCCWPLNMFGIPAIVYGARVNSKVALGDIEGAKESSRKAKMWCWITFGIEALGLIAYASIYAILISMGIIGNTH